ncbi:MAG: bifunctional 2',3'-cyclic-nucleotide 2'-phosphodiesterase/3'-nucleotidase [Endozoicomonadaceae bacterium]|nr:bifunctional 2',3'-cyclic-nucleotide 2'-phosphodiesterase/3'-nucleotidase [Endozoicomonadaceae bacterium]
MSVMTTQAATVELRVLETTDLHVNIMDFDYYKDRHTDQYGLVRAATLIREARNEVINSLLVDNGDLLQGSPMGDYAISRVMDEEMIHPAYKAMNRMEYDVANLGNHDFNYGLEFLNKAISGANFPYICGNVFNATTGQHHFTPYLIKTYDVTDTSGAKRSIRIGFLGLLPPQILSWDYEHLKGRVIVQDIVETAEQLVPAMRAEGAEIVIVLSHSSFVSEPHKPMAEQAVNGLSQVKGIDAIVFGHAHKVFPGPDFEQDVNVDVDKGTINGIPAVMPGFRGNHIGLIDLTLDNHAGYWQVVGSQSEARPLTDANHKPRTNADLDLVAALMEDHEGTRAFIGQPIGKSSSPIYSYLALIQDSLGIQIVNDAQMDYAHRMASDHAELRGLPILAASAPFKAGGQQDPANYTEVESGELTFRTVVDLYPFPNNLVVLKVSGSDLKEWLECAAGQFNQIDPDCTSPQNLINDHFPTHHFDVIDGIDYQINITQPARYDEHCRLVNSDAERIEALMWQERPIAEQQHFLVATNNYRAYGGKFVGTGAEAVVYTSPENNQNILADYIERKSHSDGIITVVADNNWRLVSLDNPNVDIRFKTSPEDKVFRFIKDNARYPLTFLHKNNNGFSVYRINLLRQNTLP